ncbi:hypothetical protein BT63DRAFT_49859 [Microthyrium microscopicum]|uniref:Uncharacterized protein n=1 Tax=Microthyrium microscopicum TaxID=703497 RepID=A0A6A6U1C5_9PEZI|nr:hypothetical protein BT63DRAFT_49859 [Microthyrium microscopicum]
MFHVSSGLFRSVTANTIFQSQLDGYWILLVVWVGGWFYWLSCIDIPMTGSTRENNWSQDSRICGEQGEIGINLAEAIFQWVFYGDLLPARCGLNIIFRDLTCQISAPGSVLNVICTEPTAQSIQLMSSETVQFPSFQKTIESRLFNRTPYPPHPVTTAQRCQRGAERGPANWNQELNNSQ